MRSFGDIVVLANKNGWNVVEKVINETHYVYKDGNTYPIGNIVKSKTIYDIKRGKTYWYHNVKYSEMVQYLNDLVNSDTII